MLTCFRDLVAVRKKLTLAMALQCRRVFPFTSAFLLCFGNIQPIHSHRRTSFRSSSSVQSASTCVRAGSVEDSVALSTSTMTFSVGYSDILIRSVLNVLLSSLSELIEALTPLLVDL
jgi:hypothetical protein